MVKNIKLNIKNEQIAKAINLKGVKSKLAQKSKEDVTDSKLTDSNKTAAPEKNDVSEVRDDLPKVKARTRSAFADTGTDAEAKIDLPQETDVAGSEADLAVNHLVKEEPQITQDDSVDLEPDFKNLDDHTVNDMADIQPKASVDKKSVVVDSDKLTDRLSLDESSDIDKPSSDLPAKEEDSAQSIKSKIAEVKPAEFKEKLGPTGRHIKDFIKPKPKPKPVAESQTSKPQASSNTSNESSKAEKLKSPRSSSAEEKTFDDFQKNKTSKFKEFRDVKSTSKKQGTSRFDARDRQGLRSAEDEQRWRKRRGKSHKHQQQEDLTIRPTSLKVRLPITIKDLAAEMKLKSSQLVGKLFLQGMVVTLNDALEDETTIQLLGQEFGCDIQIDTSEAERIQITDKTIKEELAQTDQNELSARPPVVVFMGHVDHGKTSLIDYIRKSNRASSEAGDITQHIGAFRCKTEVGELAVLDTPGHEAFSAMRARGADVTDIVVLVVAGDEGIKQQTIEAIEHAKAANVVIIVAINKCDKPNFNPENVYRQLAEQDLLPESWGGQIITVNCSAATGEGVKELLEMLALQAEVLELKANPSTRARGTVLESEMHKGMGSVATVLVQNGTLKLGDALVFGEMFGRVKTMRDEDLQNLQLALPSTPVEITGLSGLPEAGQEFIVVKSEKEAKDIAQARSEGAKQSSLMQKKKICMDNILLQASAGGKKTLNIIIRADVQGSLEALRVALLKINSDKVDVNIISAAVGEVSESDVNLAAASKAVIIGFHAGIESHAEPLVKQLGVQVRSHDIIYHAIDDVKVLMAGTLEKIAQTVDKGQAFVKAVFKSSHAGVIAGCQVSEGTIHRNHSVRVIRDKKVIWEGGISSLKRVKEDVREVQKGVECGILLNGFSDIKEDDILQSFETIYIAQEI